MESSRLLSLEIRLFSMKVSYYNPPPPQHISQYLLCTAFSWRNLLLLCNTQIGLELKDFGAIGFKHWLLTRDN